MDVIGDEDLTGSGEVNPIPLWRWIKPNYLLSYSLALAFAASSAQSADVKSATSATKELRYRRGVNVLAHDPFWKNPAKARFQLKHFAEIRRGGFDFIRVNMFVFEHLDAQGRIDPKWLGRLDWVLANAKRAGLGVILDEHDSGACKKDRAQCPAKLRTVWRQLASRYRAESSSVAFELLNEPDSCLDAATWNALFPELLSIIRGTNPARTVIIAPLRVEDVKLPPGDRNIIVTFHYYSPFRFTHQGAPWTRIKELLGVTWGTPRDRERIRALFDKISAWASMNRRPILLGEFGVYDKSGIPLRMRVDYTAMVACEAERRGFGWAYWQFDGNFIAWDMKRDTWMKPIKEALIPRGARPRVC